MSQPESVLVEAERHVREAEERVARQATFIEKLERDGHARASEEARKLLASFEQTLDVQRQHLAVEREAHKGRSDP
jgi:hypothetical protein